MKKKIVSAIAAAAVLTGSLAAVPDANAQSSGSSFPRSSVGGDSRRIGPIIGITLGAVLSSAGIAAAVSSHQDPGVPPVPSEEPQPEPPAEQPEPPVEQPEVPAEQPVQNPAPAPQAPVQPAPVADAPRQQIASVPSGATELAPGIQSYI